MPHIKGCFSRTKCFSVVATMLFISICHPALAAPPSSPSAKKTPVTVGGGNPTVISKQPYHYKFGEETLDHTLLKQKAKLGSYELYEEICDSGGLVTVKLSLDGKVLLDKKLRRWQGLCEPHFSITDPLGGDGTQKPVARDINKDGIPELIVWYVDESAHGPSDLTIYQLDGKPVLKSLFKGSFVSGNFQDVDNDGAFEIIERDNVFEGFYNAASVQTRFPEVTLAWDGTTYKPSAKLMKQKAPTEAEMNAMIAESEKAIKSDFASTKVPAGSKVIAPGVWNNMIKLVYTGNTKAAKQLLERMYPSGKLAVVTIPDQVEKVMTRDEFWNAFVAQLKKSKWVAGISLDG